MPILEGILITMLYQVYDDYACSIHIQPLVSLAGKASEFKFWFYYSYLEYCLDTFMKFSLQRDLGTISYCTWTICIYPWFGFFFNWCSLERTQMDYIDLYQIHWPDRFVCLSDVYFQSFLSCWYCLSHILFFWSFFFLCFLWRESELINKYEFWDLSLQLTLNFLFF